MITILNRKELFLTWDTSAFDRVLNQLTSTGIKYTFRTRGGAHGIAGINADYAYEYRVYVHRDDYERARYVMNKI